MPRALLVAATLLLSACVPTLQTAVDPARLPAATDYGPHAFPMEWWYVSGFLPEEGLAFHWAQFQVRAANVPVPVMISHLALTDLRTGQVTFLEQSPGLGQAAFPPLKLGQGNWRLEQQGTDFRLNAGPLDLTLHPLKGPVLHPPGYSGSAETGLLYYQGVTRLALSGQVAGRSVQGQAWLDHQWGNQIPGRAALWDWFSVQLRGGDDLMVYRVRTPDGRVVQTVGSIVDARGNARPATNLTVEPGRTWQSAGGRTYTLSWHLRADEFDLTAEAVRDEQELLSRTTNIAYWEGPIRVMGTWGGQPETGQGMLEVVGGLLQPPAKPQ
ncbi:hypothetical protein Dcar01_03136 [Deinococcus carri]|uniref:AttH domain-containing protein n=1 Tax=Deinococcus carri TaxID=1211323 RepID=A0ABP9WAL3_9DEIO